MFRAFRLVAPLNPSGLGTHAQHLALGLIYWELMQKCDFILEPRGKLIPSISKASYRTLEAKMISQHRDMVPDVTVVMDLPAVCNKYVTQMRPSGKKVAYTVFELHGPMGPEFKRLFENFDEVWLPTEWAMDEAIGQGYDEQRMQVVPEGVFEAPPRIDERNEWDRPIRVASVGKFEVRKGQDILINSLLEMPEYSFIVEAYWHNAWAPGIATEFLKQYRHRCAQHSHGVSAVPVQWPEDRMHVPQWEIGNVTVRLNNFQRFNEDMWGHLREHSDIAVFPHLAEGWGLPILEAVSCGIPTIASLSTGPRVYLNPYYSSMKEAGCPISGIKVTDLQFAFDPVFYNNVVKENYWYVPSVKEVTTSVREALAWKPSVLAQAASKAGGKVAQVFSWKNASMAFLEAVGEACAS